MEQGWAPPTVVAPALMSAQNAAALIHPFEKTLRPERGAAGSGGGGRSVGKR